MLIRNEIVQSVQFAERNQQGEHHGETAEDGPGDKVRRKDRGVPTGDNGGGKVKGNNAVHGKHEGR